MVWMRERNNTGQVENLAVLENGTWPPAPERAHQSVRHSCLFATTVAKTDGTRVRHSKNSSTEIAFHSRMNITFAKEREGFRNGDGDGCGSEGEHTGGRSEAQSRRRRRSVKRSAEEKRETAGETQRATEPERRVTALQAWFVAKTVGQKQKKKKPTQNVRGRERGLQMPTFDEARLEVF